MTSASNIPLHALPSTPPFSDVAIITRSVENVFRKLIRILVGRMSLKKLQELIQVIFVEETEAKLKRAAPEKNVALADVALLTGMDTRTIKKTKSYIALNKPPHQDDTFLDGFMPMFKVFDLWMNDERFFDAKRGKPNELDIDGEGATFSQLVKLAIQSRGLSTQLVLKRLKEIDVISVNSSTQVVKLKQEDNIFISKDELDSLEVGFAAIGSLVDTVNHNIQNSLNDDKKYYQRGSWNFQLAPEKMDHIQKAIGSFLSKTDIKARKLLDTLSEPEIQQGQVTAGIGMFFFEEK